MVSIKKENIKNEINKNEGVVKFQTNVGKIIEQFLNEKKKRSEKTYKGYKADIEEFFNVVFNKTIDNVSVEDLHKIDYELFNNYIEGLGDVSNSTKNRNISSLRSLFHTLSRDKNLKLDFSFMESYKLLPNSSTRIEAMPREVVMNYINEAGRELHHADIKQKLIMFAVDTGLRLEDYLEMEWKQFSPQDDHVLLHGYGKGNKRWIEKISYDVYNELLEINKGQSKVFSPLSKKNVSDMMNRIKRNLRYEDREYSFHSFKKTAVTFTYRLTGDILEAMKKGRHSNIETTRIYLEEEDYGMTGMFSLGDHDTELYKKATHEELLEALNMMNKDAVHLLNIKLKQMREES